MGRITESLLLLPPSKFPLSSRSLSAFHRPAVTACVNVLKALPTSSELLVVLPCPSLHDRLNIPRSNIYSEAQELVGQLYSLICFVCAELGVDVEGGAPGALDARIVLLDYDLGNCLAAEDVVSTGKFSCGPIINLLDLVISRRRWSYIFSVDSVAGQQFLAEYNRIAGDLNVQFSGHMQGLPSGPESVPDQAYSSFPSNLTSKIHHVVAVGGTFDHLHAGHKLLLTATALLLQPPNAEIVTTRRLVVGITGDELLKNKKYVQYLKSWQQRQQDVLDFLVSILSFPDPAKANIRQTYRDEQSHPNSRTVVTSLEHCSIVIECVEIQDPFGPTITDETVSALVVSGETRAGGKAVNERRIEKDWQPLNIFEINVLDAVEATENEGSSKGEEFASKISSTAIRKRKAEKTQASSSL